MYLHTKSEVAINRNLKSFSLIKNKMTFNLKCHQHLIISRVNYDHIPVKLRQFLTSRGHTNAQTDGQTPVEAKPALPAYIADAQLVLIG